jgi:hypothetical protein
MQPIPEIRVSLSEHVPPFWTMSPAAQTDQHHEHSGAPMVRSRLTTVGSGSGTIEVVRAHTFYAFQSNAIDWKWLRFSVDDLIL